MAHPAASGCGWPAAATAPVHPERLRDSAARPRYDWCAGETSDAKTTTELR